jgi:arginine/serine-rich splicing factor 7
LLHIGSNASKQELEEAFSYYGSLRNVWVARNPPGFAFVEFEEPRDAEDAVRGLDGRYVNFAMLIYYCMYEYDDICSI